MKADGFYCVFFFNYERLIMFFTTNKRFTVVEKSVSFFNFYAFIERIKFFYTFTKIVPRNAKTRQVLSVFGIFLTIFTKRFLKTRGFHVLSKPKEIIKKCSDLDELRVSRLISFGLHTMKIQRESTRRFRNGPIFESLRLDYGYKLVVIIYNFMAQGTVSNFNDITVVINLKNRFD